MSDITTIQVLVGDITNVVVNSNQEITSVVVRQSDITTLQATAATITVSSISLSDDLPLELANTASAGTSNKAARADHRHPSTGIFLDGGNF